MAKKVFVGLSGGVDSSVSAALLKEQGYEVVGVYMKNWSQDLPGFPCPWKEDYQDAKRVAVQLGIEFRLFDFEKQYRQKVVETMIEQFKQGVTPNPDIMCNQEIKFKLFLETALEQGADLIATGHYARVANGEKQTANDEQRTKNSEREQRSLLQMARDTNKDQTYFLYRITEEALAKTLFPLGNLTKPEVRELAKKFKLVTADKKESMGICFVGKVGIKDFLKQYVKEEPGAVVDQNGQQVGQHEGAIFYTIGQRHGLNIGGGLPYYVTGKDMVKNEVYVTNRLDDPDLWSDSLTISSVHWINDGPEITITKSQFSLRTRHRAPLVDVKKITKLSDDTWQITLYEAVRAVTPGQSAVLYAGQTCLGGGIVTLM